MRGNGNAATIPDPGSIRLAPGSHESPRDGACVVELASILAGEEFSDRPRCVDPVIAAFLRGWNDRAGHADRQRLRPYAERIVGSRADQRRTRQRREICLRWAELADSPDVTAAANRARTRIRIAVYCGLVAAVRLDEGAGDYAARVAFSHDQHDEAFALLDALLEGVPGQPGSAATSNGNGSHPSANGSEPAGQNGSAPASRNGGRRRSVNGSGPNGDGSAPAPEHRAERPPA